MATTAEFKPRLTGGWYEMPKHVRDRIAQNLPGGGETLRLYERRLPRSVSDEDGAVHNLDERLVVMVEQHPMDSEARRGWHLSISHQVLDQRGVGSPGRYPTWDEIKDARYRFTPTEVEMCMILPRPSDFVNVHETCFHLHQHFEP